MRATVAIVASLLLALWAAWPIQAERSAAPALDPEQPYQARKVNPVMYSVDFSAVVTPPSHTKVLKVWLPLPQSDSAQEIKEGDLSSFPMKVQPVTGTEKLYGNRFAYFEFKNP